MFNDPISPCILIAACLGLLLQLAQSFHYRRERRYIKTARRQLKSHPGGDLDLGVPKSAEVGRRAEGVAALAAQRLPIHVADFSLALEARDEAAWLNRLPQYILSVLLLGGLFGTLIALGKAVNDPALFNSQGELDAATLKEFSDVVQGSLRNAFDASKWGIGSTICLLLTRALFISGPRAHFFSEIDEFTTRELVPRLAPQASGASHPLAEATSRFGQAADRLSSLATDLAASHAGAKSSTDGLVAFSGRLGESATKLAEVFAAGTPVERAIVSISSVTNEQSRLFAQWQKALSEEHQSFTAALSHVKSGLTSTGQLWSEAQKITTRFESAMAQSLGTLKEGHQAVRQLLDEQGKTLASEAKDRKATVQAISKDLAQLTSTVGELGKVTSALQATTKAIEQAGLEQKKTSQDLAQALLTDLKATKDYVFEFRNAATELERNLKAALVSLGTSISEGLKGSAESVSVASKSFARLPETLAALQKCAAALEGSQRSGQEIAKTMERVKGLDRLADALSEIAAANNRPFWKRIIGRK